MSIGNEETSAHLFFSFFFLVKLLGHYTTRSLHIRDNRSALHSLMGDSRWDGMQCYTNFSLLVLSLSFKDFFFLKRN